MRFKLVFLIKNDTYGNTLPVSYQYELSSCIRRMITGGGDLYADWLQKNGFEPDHNVKYSLFSLSNFYIPKIKVEGDRLQVLAKRVQMWISFLPERDTPAFVEQIFQNQTILIGDKKTRMELEIERVTCVDEPQYAEKMDYLTLSPVVASLQRANKSIEYLDFLHETYHQVLLDRLLDKYSYFYSKEFPFPFDYNLELLNDPKRKGIFIKRFTPNESKVIGFMYKFRLTAHPILHKLLYNTGFGDKISLGFGCVEVIK